LDFSRHVTERGDAAGDHEKLAQALQSYSAERDSWKEKIDPFAIFKFPHSVYANHKGRTI
jgi:hypothetical protein